MKYGNQKILAWCIRTAVKLIFIVGSWWYLISGIWGHDISFAVVEHMLRYFTIGCCMAQCYRVKFNDTGKASLTKLAAVVIFCVLAAAVGYLLYQYVIRTLLIFLGKIFGTILVVMIGLYFVAAPALAASSHVAALGSMGASLVRDKIRSGEINLSNSDNASNIKSELASQLGIDYDAEHQRYEEDRKRRGWE